MVDRPTASLSHADISANIDRAKTRLARTGKEEPKEQVFRIQELQAVHPSNGKSSDFTPSWSRPSFYYRYIAMYTYINPRNGQQVRAKANTFVPELRKSYGNARRCLSTKTHNFAVDAKSYAIDHDEQELSFGVLYAILSHLYRFLFAP